jgi:hypothetical protein
MMFYSKDQLQEVKVKLKLFIDDAMVKDYYKPVPEYALTERWTDEDRLKHGYKQLNGGWVEMKSKEQYWNGVVDSIETLFDDNAKLVKDLNLAKETIHEMEYGLRVASKALQNSLKLTKEVLTKNDEHL